MIVVYRIIIAGSREFIGTKALSYAQTKLIHLLNGKGFYPAEIEFISGGAQGADRIGETFARMYAHLGAKLTIMKADWELFGRGAGYIRNEQMAIYASENTSKGMLVAFWDGRSKGTDSMINLAKEYGLEVVVFNYIRDWAI